MPRNAEGMLDDIGAAPASPEPEAAPAPDPVEAEETQTEQVSAEPEKKDTAKPDPANSPTRPDGYVPRQALEEARREAKEHRERAAILEDRTNKILERYFSQNQAEQPETREAPPDPGEEPDAADNPYEWITWRQQKDRFEAHQRNEVTARQTATQRAIGEKQAEYAAVREQFPAIEEARQTVLKGWHRELWLQGYRGAALEQRVAQTEAQWAIYAHQQNMPIGEVIAGLAMARGWQPPADDAAKKDEPAEKDTPQRDPTTGKFVAAEAEKAARIKESQERNGSLTQAPGTPVEKMTAKELAKMSETEMWSHFDKMKGRKGSKDFDREMGFR